MINSSILQQNMLNDWPLPPLIFKVSAYRHFGLDTPSPLESIISISILAQTPHPPKHTDEVLECSLIIGLCLSRRGHCGEGKSQQAADALSRRKSSAATSVCRFQMTVRDGGDESGDLGSLAALVLGFGTEVDYVGTIAVGVQGRQSHANHGWSDKERVPWLRVWCEPCYQRISQIQTWFVCGRWGPVLHVRVIRTDGGRGGDRSPIGVGDTWGGQGSDGEGLARDSRQNLEVSQISKNM